MLVPASSHGQAGLGECSSLPLPWCFMRRDLNPQTLPNVSAALDHTRKLLREAPPLAARQAREILSAAGDHPEAWRLLGAALRRTGDDAALAELEKIDIPQEDKARQGLKADLSPPARVCGGLVRRRDPARPGPMKYWEDLEIGVETVFGHYDVTREEVLEFAGKYDPQPFHLSDEAAARTHFGRLAASGWHSCAMMMAVLVRYSAREQHAGLGSPGVDELRWLKPVHPGDRLTVSGTLIDKTPSRSKPAIGVIRTATRVTNQDGIDVMTLTSIVLMRRRPTADA